MLRGGTLFRGEFLVGQDPILCDNRCFARLRRLFNRVIFLLLPMSQFLEELEIRQLRGLDAEAFQQLRREVTAANPGPMGLTLEEESARKIDGFREQLSYPAPNAAFGAFLAGRLIASAAVAWPSKLASSRHKTNLWGVFVSTAHRRKGIGRALVNRAIEHAFEFGARRVNLQVFVPNEEAVSLYRSFGFVECGFEPESVCLGNVYHDGVYMSLLRPASTGR